MARRDPAARARDGKRVLIVGQLDGYANSVRPVELESFLRKRGHDVRLVDTYYLSRASQRRGSLAAKLPRPGLRRLAIYGVELAALLLTRGWALGRRHLSYYAVRADCRLRGSLLRSLLPLDEFDLVVVETPHDVELLTAATSAETLYDCPTPWADELWFEGRLTERQHRRLRRWESTLFERVDRLAFHWQSYAEYARGEYGLRGENLVTLDWGCTPAAERATFERPPRIVYLGSLSGEFIDLPLLARLSRLYPHIDVYGGPPPPPELGLRYRGYASPAVLRDYQVGLVTARHDRLRVHGFSAKHPQYLAYGLPVLVPSWREHLELLRGSVPYDEGTFLASVEALSDEREWQRRSDEAYAQAQCLSWERTLQPLEELLAA